MLVLYIWSFLGKFRVFFPCQSFKILCMDENITGLILHGGNEGDCLYSPWSIMALVPLKCSSRNLQFRHRVPFTGEKMPWCPFKNGAIQAWLCPSVASFYTFFLVFFMAEQLIPNFLYSKCNFSSCSWLFCQGKIEQLVFFFFGFWKKHCI